MCSGLLARDFVVELIGSSPRYLTAAGDEREGAAIFRPMH
jgi:hypothetical protein